MMSYKRKLLWLLSLNAVLLILIALGLLFAPGRTRPLAVRVSLPSQPEAIASIELSGPVSIQLTRSGAQWTALRSGQTLPASASRIEAFLQLLTSLGRLELAARSRSSWESLGLGVSDSVSLRLARADGSSISECILGSYAPAGGLAYLAFKNDERVFLVPGTLAGFLRASDVSWLDTAVFGKLNPDSVETVRVNGSLPDGQGSIAQYDYSMSRLGQGWVNSSTKAELDAVQAESMLRQLCSLNAADFAPEEERAGPVILSVVLSLGDGRELALRVEQALPDGRHPVTVASIEGLRWYVSAWSLRDALKQLKDMAKP